MKTECTRLYSSFQALGRREIFTDFNGWTITSDGGVLFPIWQLQFSQIMPCYLLGHFTNMEQLFGFGLESQYTTYPIKA
jgi:hypothetical protein